MRLERGRVHPGPARPAPARARFAAAPAPAAGRDPGGGQRPARRGDPRARGVRGSPRALRGGAGPGPRLRPQSRAWSRRADEVVAFLDDDAVADAGLGRCRCPRCSRRSRGSRCAPGGSSRWGWTPPGERLFEANGGFSRGLERIRLPDDADRPLHGRPAPLIAWAMSVGSGCSYAVRRERCARAGRIRRGARSRRRHCRAAAITTCSGGLSRPGTRWSTSRPRSPGTSTGRGRARRATRSSATSARWSPSWQAPGGGRRGRRGSLAGYLGVAARSSPACACCGARSDAIRCRRRCCSACGGTAGSGLTAYPRARRLARARAAASGDAA